MLNIFLIINLVILCFIIFLNGYVGTFSWTEQNSAKMYYIFPERSVDSKLYSQYSMASYYLLFNGMLPLDLQINLLLVKLLYTLLIEYDV
jgi:hypothetical protein